jgi:hypothetical protein
MTVAKYSSTDFYEDVRTAYGDCEEIKRMYMLFPLDVKKSLIFSGEYYVATVAHILTLSSPVMPCGVVLLICT